MNSRERNIHGGAQVGELVVAVFQRLAPIWGVIIRISTVGLNNISMGGRTS